MHRALRFFIAFPIIALAAFACSENKGVELPGDPNEDPADGSKGDEANAQTSDAAADETSTANETGAADTGPTMVGPDGGISSLMNFFVTSKGRGKGGDLRDNGAGADGLAGADAFCKSLAGAIAPVLGAKNWKAYLSTGAVNARDRIPKGPFYNAKGVLIAANVSQLHDEGGLVNAMSLVNSLDEGGNQVPAVGTVMHDVMTGTIANGKAAADHCNNWTSSGTGFKTQVGHSNRDGGGAAPTSWNAAHVSGGCEEGTGGTGVGSGGGRGSYYCFAD